MSIEERREPEKAKPRRPGQGFEEQRRNYQETNVMTKNSTTAAQIVPFRHAELLLVDRDGEPFVPMRPIVQGMGLDWKSQHVKLSGGRFSTCMVEITTQLPGETQRRAVACLPLRKLPGWLMSIHPNKVREELRDGIIAYQNECDDVLWAYWNEGMAVRRDDRTVETVLNSTIGTDGFHMLGALIKGKVASLPVAAQRRATAKLWSQTHAAFGVRSAADIPADQLDAARNFIAAYAIHEGEWIGKTSTKAGTFADILGRPMTPDERWLIYTDHAGNEQHKPVPSDACVLSHRDLIKGMLSDIPVSTEDMFEFAMAVVANLKIRHDHQVSLVKAGRAAA
ncbi:phage antirepressor N-terminal domain-containing protein [Azotobacter salinestris]|uniref:phage antirepressor N-terminal domain-containing protein n=1 Tax=Azotobacter salinestris TaxID=69964 RepID=UPI0032DFB96B